MYDCVALLFVIIGLFNNPVSAKINGTLSNLPIFGPRARLEIEPPLVPGIAHKLIIKKTNESLNLTCTVVQHGGGRNDTLFDYTVDWKISSPNNSTSNFDRGNIKNMAWLWFNRLTERDAGNYTCHAITSEPIGQPHISVNIYLSVKSIKTKPSYCGSQWFRCRSTNCIMERYVCDGKKDCEEGEDEGPDAGCKPDPCYGKIFCGERCIPPEWCCDYRNCTSTFGLRPSETHEISYVQTAFYTVIGCAMAFMFIVTILVIAICRVQIKRAMNTRWNQRNNRDICRRQTRSVSLNMPIYDVDVYLNRTADNYPTGVNIMYNINSGVQFVGQPVEPPPYSEVMATPPREGPPPPYVSCEDLMEQSTITSSRVVNSSNTNNNNSQNTCQIGPLTIPPPPPPLPLLSQSLQNTENTYTSDIPYDYYSMGLIHEHTDQLIPELCASTSLNSRNSPAVSSNEVSQAFDQEYVETDALLSNSTRNKCKIMTQNPRERDNQVWKPNARNAIVKSKWLTHDYKDNDDDVNNKIVNFNCQISLADSNDDNQDSNGVIENLISNSTLVRGGIVGKELTLGDIENEGIFLDTDNQLADSTSNSPLFISKNNTTCLLSSCSGNDLVNNEPGPSTFSRNEYDQSCKINHDEKLIDKQNDVNNHNDNEDDDDNEQSNVDNIGKNQRKNLLSHNTASQDNNSDNITRANSTLIGNNSNNSIKNKNKNKKLPNNKSNESSTNMSTSVNIVTSNNICDDGHNNDNDNTSNELDNSVSLILPLRESFIGVQRGN